MGSLHPAIVHIPIGLLFVYSLIQIGVSLFPKFDSSVWTAKYIMLIIGLIGGYFAMESGESAEELYESMKAVIHMHENFATATLWVYAVPAVFLTVQKLKENSFIQSFAHKHIFFEKGWNIILSLSKFFTHRFILFLFAFVGGLLLSITGALGGAIAHGPKTDFFVEWVYNWLF